MRIATFVFAVVYLLLLAIATPADAGHKRDDRRCDNVQCKRPSTITRQTTRTTTTTRHTVRRPAR